MHHMRKLYQTLLTSTILVGIIIINTLSTQAQQSASGDVNVQITVGNSCCIYGTAIVFGAKDVSLGITEFTGDFFSYHGTTTRSCRDMAGTDTGWAMYISMSGNLVNSNGASIPKSNVKISFDKTQLIGGDCVSSTNTGIDLALNTSVSLVEKDATVASNFGKLCELATPNVKLKVVTNKAQAAGNYVGTLVIDLPNFFNNTCT